MDSRAVGRRVAAVVACLLAVSAGAQVEQNDLEIEGERSLQASISVYQTFDDNLFEEGEDQESELVTYVRPQYDLFYPFRFAAIDISAGIPIYYHWRERDETEALYDIAGAISTARARGFAVTVRDHLIPVAIALGRVDYEESNKNKVQSNEFSVTPSYQFNLTSRSSMTLRYIFGMVHYLDPEIGENYLEHTGSLTSSTFITARLEFVAQYAYVLRDLLDIDIGRQIHQGRIGLQATWSRLVLGVFGGVSYITFTGRERFEKNDENRLGEYIDGSINWAATPWLTLSLTYRRILTDDIFANAYFSQTGTVDFAFPITSWFAVRLGAFVRDYRSDTQVQRSDAIFGGSADVTFTVRERLNLFAGYKYAQNIGEAEANDFTNHFVLAGLKFTF